MHDVWLEVRSCQDPYNVSELAHETVLRIPVLSEVMKIAENTLIDMQKKGGREFWDYSRKLDPGEIVEVAKLFKGIEEKDEGKASTHMINVSFGGRLYTLSLFASK